MVFNLPVRLVRRFRHELFVALSLVPISVLFSPIALAQAGQTINVPNGDVAGLITAIQTLNANGGGTINLATDGTYSVTAPSDWWFGPNAFPAIASAITINGNGATISRASGSPKFRFFYVSGGFSTLSAGNLNLSNLTLTGGLAQGGNGGTGSPGGGGGAGLGGAIFNQGAVSLSNVTFSLNQALGGSGGTGEKEGKNSGGGGGLGGSGGSSTGSGNPPGTGGGGGFKANGQKGGGTIPPAAAADSWETKEGHWGEAQAPSAETVRATRLLTLWVAEGEGSNPAKMAEQVARMWVVRVQLAAETGEIP